MTEVSHPSPNNMAGKWQAGDVSEADSIIGQDSAIGKPMATKVAEVSNFAEHNRFLHQAMPD